MSDSVIFMADRLADTERLAAMLAEVVGPNHLIALDGDLGAGKTAFSRMLAARLGVQATVNSPTFQLIKEYEAANMPFFHMDVYRIDGSQAEQLGLDEYFYGGGLSLVEWASKISDCLPDAYLHVAILKVGPPDSEHRKFILSPHGEPYQSWCAHWLASGLMSSEIAR